MKSKKKIYQHILALLVLTAEGALAQYQTYIDPGSRVLDKTIAVVGSTAGAFSVNDFGEAVYKIPIFTSPGTAGMVPNISLIYNSNNGDGLMGSGWAIAGLSTIHRVPQNFYHEGRDDGVDLETTDRFALDGNRLILVSGGYGQDQSIYRTELETFTRVTANGASGTGPSWFKAETKDGRTIEYGNTVDSRVEANGLSTVYLWRVNKVTDKFGNYIKFTYNEVNGESYISSIDYTGSGITQEPYNCLKFYYSQRNDINSSFIGGSRIPSTMILTSIRMESENNLVREYNLKYFTDTYNKTHLNEIKELGSDGSYFNSTLFGWSSHEPQFSKEEVFSNGLKNNFYFGDFNGDGVKDFIQTPIELIASSTWKLYIGNTNGTTFRLAATDTIGSDFAGFVIADYDGNGKDNIFLHRITSGNVFESYDYNIEYAPGAPEVFLEQINRLPSLDLTFAYISNLSSLVGDFDGDGTKDLALLKEDSTIYQVVGINIPPISIPNIRNIHLMDFDGDGREEIMAGNAVDYGIWQYNPLIQDFLLISSSTSPTFDDRIYIGDFNGDGKDDILSYTQFLNERRRLEKTWILDFSTGTGFIRSQYTPALSTLTDPELSPDNHNVYIADFNGDGMDDILYSSTANAVCTLKVFFSYGEGRTQMVSNTFSADTVKQEYLTVGDFSGKGNAELFYYDYSLTSNAAHLISLSYGQPNPVIKEISDGLNNKIKISYNRLNIDNGLFYDYQSYLFGYPNGLFNGPAYSVEKVKNTSGTLDESGTDIYNTSTFSYGGLMFNKYGKGLLGFRMIQQKDSITGVTTRKSYNFLSGYPILCLSTIQNSNSQGNITSYTATWDLISYGNKRIMPYNSTETIQNHITNTSEHFSRSIDNNGNITSSQSINKNGTYPELTTNVAYTGYSSYGNWGLPNKPLSITTTATYKTKDPVTTGIVYAYNQNGTISSEKRFIGTIKETTTNYAYYPSGNLHSTTLSAEGLTSRSTSYEYDSKGRFVITIGEPDGKESHSVKDPGTGNTISLIGIDSLTTTYQYDGLGRLLKTTTPLDHDILSALVWDNTSTDIPSVYYSAITAPGRPGVIGYYDSYGRILRSSGDAFGGTVFVDREYNPEGTVKRVSWPYRSGDNKRWTGYTYDDYQRLTVENNNSIITQYSYNLNAVTVTGPDQKSKTTVLNSINQPVQITENDNSQIIYDYNSFGQVCSVTTPGNLVSFFYDQYGLRDSIYNSNSGGVKLLYNAFGELVSQTDENGLETQVQYDVLGRVTTKTTPEGITSYNYVGMGNGVRQISSVTGPGGVSEGYQYDEYGRLTQFSRTIQNEITLNYQYLYDQYGNNTSVTFPSAMRIDNVYDTYGNLIEIKQENGTLIWQLNSLRSTGNPSQYTLGPNSLTRTFGYDSHEQLSNITTGLWQQSYSFNPSTGNLNSRSYKNINSQDELAESFQYDLMNRLTTSQVNGLQQYSVTYDQTGNILTKSDAGNYIYDQTRVNALVTLENNPGTISPDMQSITYNSLNKPVLISEGDYSNGFLYGTDGQRFRSELFRNDTLIKSRYYGPGYEKTVTADSTWENYYIVSPFGLAAVIVKESGSATIYYAETDHLGSLIGLMHSNGTHAERFSFDAWGRRRNPSDWSYSNVPEPILTERGFTGHEHMDMFGLINMNGRIYDPVTARFLNVDPVIQNPYSTHDYNSFSYCNSNPLKYTDPSGYQKSYDSSPEPIYVRVPGHLRIQTYMLYDAGYGNGTGSGMKANAEDYAWEQYVIASQNGYSETFNNFSDQFWKGYYGRSANGKINVFAGWIDYFTCSKTVGEEEWHLGQYINSEPYYITINQGPHVGGGEGVDFSLARMYGHFQFGGGKPLIIDASTLDFSGTNQRTLGLDKLKVGQTMDPVNLFNMGKMNALALAFGRVPMTKVSDTEFTIGNNEFDFTPFYDPSASTGRNIGNVIGFGVNYNLWLGPGSALLPVIFGGPYDVIFNGSVTIPK
jgi:RHS repeat-associated protein